MAVPESILTEKVFRRVILVSALDGWSVAMVAGLSVLVALAFGDWVGIGVSLLAFAAGIMELHGRRQLLRRDATGMKWLVRAQLYLLAVVLVYCVSRMGSFDDETVLGNLTPEMTAVLQEAGIETADLLPLVRLSFFLTLGVVAIVSILVQGGLAYYYRRSTPRVAAHLTAPPSLVGSGAGPGATTTMR